MINAGLPLVQALEILAKRTENKALSEVTRAVVFAVESGHTVADTLAMHSNAFSELYVNMVAAGIAMSRFTRTLGTLVSSARGAESQALRRAASTHTRMGGAHPVTIPPHHRSTSSRAVR